MASQTDLDQGGTFRQTIRLYLGPSIGWVTFPDQAFLPIISGGTTDVLLGTTLVTVNYNGLVTVQLYSAKASPAGAGANPGTWGARPVTIVDIGGYAANNNITILPYGSETIDSLPSIAITSAYGAYTLNPRFDPNGSGGWTLTQQ